VKLKLKLLEMELSIVQLDDVPIPENLLRYRRFFALTRTSDEVSLVVETKYVEKYWKVEHGWSAFQVEGLLDFSQVGVLSGILDNLAKAQISVFTISTFNTDYILVKTTNKAKAVKALEHRYNIIP